MTHCSYRDPNTEVFCWAWCIGNRCDEHKVAQPSVDAATPIPECDLTTPLGFNERTFAIMAEIKQVLGTALSIAAKEHLLDIHEMIYHEMYEAYKAGRLSMAPEMARRADQSSANVMRGVLAGIDLGRSSQNNTIG